MRRGKKPGFVPPLTIISNGTASGTFVRDNRTGHRVPGVTRIDFDPIEAGAGFVTARLTVISGLDVVAESGRRTVVPPGFEQVFRNTVPPTIRDTVRRMKAHPTETWAGKRGWVRDCTSRDARKGSPVGRKRKG